VKNNKKDSLFRMNVLMVDDDKINTIYMKMQHSSQELKFKTNNKKKKIHIQILFMMTIQ
jgi:hypothetical protein